MRILMRKFRELDSLNARKGQMAARIHGLAIDAEGRPVAGARVFLDYSFAPEPPFGEVAVAGGSELSVAVTSATGEYAFTPETHAGLGEILRENQERAQVFEGKHLHDLSIRATRDQHASQNVVIDWNGENFKVPDLVLQPGVVGRVVVRWSDGRQAAGVAAKIMLSDPQHADERARILSFEGPTDERGELAFGPVLDHEYSISLEASHPEGPPRTEWWDARIPRDDPLELVLPRGREVSGRLMAASGQPAAGYRIAPWPPDTDPESERVVTTDSAGHFTVAAVDPEASAIAVYDKLPPPSSDPAKQLDRRSAELSPLNPLLIHQVPDGEDELGSVCLPELGTLTMRLEDTSGGCPLSGYAFWWRSSGRHGSRSWHADSHGLVRIKRIPLGIAIEVPVTIQDSQYGELEQSFNIADVNEETVTLRVTGAGTVVIRLHPTDAPQEPLVVRHVSVEWHECCGGGRDGPTSEVRWWVRPGLYPALTIKARGFRERVVKNVNVRDDGPTFLDVELEPR